MNGAQLLLLAIAIYLAIGVPAGALFLARGAPAIDNNLRASPRHVRLLLFPGAVALWPHMLILWRRRARRP